MSEDLLHEQRCALRALGHLVCVLMSNDPADEARHWVAANAWAKASLVCVRMKELHGLPDAWFQRIELDVLEHMAGVTN